MFCGVEAAEKKHHFWEGEARSEQDKLCMGVSEQGEHLSNLADFIYFLLKILPHKSSRANRRAQNSDPLARHNLGDTSSKGVLIRVTNSGHWAPDCTLRHFGGWDCGPGGKYEAPRCTFMLDNVYHCAQLCQSPYQIPIITVPGVECQGRKLLPYGVDHRFEGQAKEKPCKGITLVEPKSTEDVCFAKFEV